ncbi:MAG: hypothetical protein WBF33_09315 [Candidatus Nitrosopolaris sp.]
MAAYNIRRALFGMIKHTSTKFDIEDMDFVERNAIYVPELKMCWGACWAALKRSWKGFYAARRHGDDETATMLLDRISTIRDTMGLENEGTWF